MHKHHKIAAIVFAAVMSVSMIPTSVFADEVENADTVVTMEDETDVPNEPAIEDNSEVSGEGNEDIQAIENIDNITETENDDTFQISDEEEGEDDPIVDEEPKEIDETIEEAGYQNTGTDLTSQEIDTEIASIEEQKDEAKSAASKYTYKITPMLPPFNEFFYVETNNPDPLNFRFTDKSSIYSNNALINSNNNSSGRPILYADVRYEDTQVGRVHGGYIFYSGSTDGGEIILQEKGFLEWEDTSVKITLPVLVDEVDYLIKTYANKDSFFDNMDAVQSGLESICFYSGSSIRGKLIKPNEYWMLSDAGHQDQSFYIYSPYDREDGASLLASRIYPFRHDSLGFPSIMAEVAIRLDSSSSVKSDMFNHSRIQVTNNGVTRSYGGQGDPEGQGISKDRIEVYFDFSNEGFGLSFEEVKNLLNRYASIEMDDDIPREDALTWEIICNQVGESGSWCRIYAYNLQVNGVYQLGPPEYAFFYKNGNRQYYNASEWGVGNSVYWDGDLDYAQDSWVDGRYVSGCYIPGERFEDHPESNIVLIDTTIPQVSYNAEPYIDESYSYKWQYSITDISVIQKTAMFKYDSSTEKWIIDSNAFGGNYANYSMLMTLIDEGLLDEKYLDMVTLTKEEVNDLQVDRNTDVDPPKGLIYDGTAAPGTAYDVTGRTNIAKASVSIPNEKYTYTGKTITPPVTLTEGTKELVSGEDYEIEYSNNIDEGLGWITIKGKGKYYGETKKMFDIVPADISKVVTFSATSKKWNGYDILGYVEGNLILKHNNKELQWNRDFMITSASGRENGNLEGSVTLQIIGIGNYTGTLKKTVEVKSGLIKLTKDLKKPVLSSVSNVNSGVKVVWNKVAGAAKYRVFRKTYNTGTKKWSSWSKISDTTAVNYTDKAVKNGTKYIYTARCISADGKKYTSSYDTTGKTIIYLVRPNISSLTSPKTKRMLVKWGKNTKATGYQIQYSTSSTFASGKKTVTVKGAANVSKTISSLTAKKKYYVRVRAYKTVSGKNYYSAWSAVKNVTSK